MKLSPSVRSFGWGMADQMLSSVTNFLLGLLVAGAGGASLTIGIIVGSACLLVALVIDGPLQTAFAILGIALPGLLLQDAWRFAFFALGRGSSAFINVLVWVGLLLP